MPNMTSQYNANIDSPSSEHVESRTEPEHPYVIRLTPSVHSRLVQYFNRNENVGLRPSAVIGHLLDASVIPPVQRQRTEPVSFTNQAAVAVPVQSSYGTRPKPSNVPIQNAGFTDDEGSEDDEEEMDDEEFGYREEYVYDSPASREEATTQTSRNDMHTYCIPRQMEPKEGNVATRKRRVTVTGIDSSARPSNTTRRRSSHPERKGIGTGKQKSWTSNLRRYLYDIIAKWQREGLLHCRECDRWMRVVHKSCGLRCVNALDHVCSHIGKPMYACRLCPHQTTTSIQMRRHLKNIHVRINDFDDLTDTFQSELEERITRCFDYSDTGEPPAGPRRLLTCKKNPGEAGVGKSLLNQETTANSSSVRRFIYDLIEKWQREGNLYCRHCNRWVRLGKETPWAQTQSALGHICGHYGKPLYTCLICNGQTYTYAQMMQHVRHVHQTIARGNCSDEIDEHHLELKDLASVCYDWEDNESTGANGPPELTKEGPFLKNPRRNSPPKTSKRPKEGSCRLRALSHARRLIKDFSGKSLKMKCQLCDACNIVKSKNGVVRPEVLLNHVLNHLDQDAYACRYCEKTAKRAENMRMHVTIRHKNVDSADYTDNTGNMQEEIINMMKQCYDKNDNVSVE